MPTGLKGILSSLSVRLLVRLLLTMAIVFAAYGVISYKATSDRWTDTIYGLAVQTGDLVKRATQYGMMLNRKEDVHQTIRLIAQTPGVAGIRIYDKSGAIIFSANEGEIGQQVDMQAEACVICHDKAEPLRSLSTENRMRMFKTAGGERVLGVIDPIQNEPGCSSAACHAHPPSKSVLGVLDVKMSMAALDDALAATRAQVFWVTLIMALIVGVGTIVYVTREVRRPLARLQDGVEHIALGNLSTRIDIDSSDEIGKLARAFNRMTGDLQEAHAQLEDWSHKLEREVAEKTEELSRIQRQIIHMEKMASLGKLSATVAHEINNPLAGILTYAKLVERSLPADFDPPEERAEVERYVKAIQKETARCGDIVRNLLLFARQSGARFREVHVDEVVERSVLLVRHHLEMSGIELSTELIEGEDDMVCDGDQLQQALVALLMNAVEAMSGNKAGRLSVRAAATDDNIYLHVGDTGGGIPEDVLPHIFEPFFSTKDKESGVGLGLAVVYGIVQRHGGQIDVTTAPGQGTTFHLKIPRRPRPGARDGDNNVIGQQPTRV